MLRRTARSGSSWRGVVLSVLASLVLARRIVTPIQALEAGAARIGAGALDQRIDVKTGDELEGLADQFNAWRASSRSRTRPSSTRSRTGRAS